MEVSLALLADAANTANDGSLNILGVRHQINAFGVPFQYPHLAVVILIKATPGEKSTQHPLRLLLVDDDGKEVCQPTEINLQVPAEFQGPELFMQLISNLLGVTFSKVGTYRLDIVLDGQSRAQLPLRVNLVTPPPDLHLPPPPSQS